MTMRKGTVLCLALMMVFILTAGAWAVDGTLTLNSETGSLAVAKGDKVEFIISWPDELSRDIVTTFLTGKIPGSTEEGYSYLATVSENSSGVLSQTYMPDEDTTLTFTAYGYDTFVLFPNPDDAIVKTNAVTLKVGTGASPTTTSSGDGGGGCAVGFVGLALLLAVPMFLKRK